MERRKTKKIRLGNIYIGDDSLVSVQSMCNTDTRDVSSTISQINKLSDAGCEIIRVAVLNHEAAVAINKIKKQINIPIIADIHFDYRLAIESIKHGVDGLRLNPGNIGSIDNVKKVVTLAKEKEIPIRIGVNSGSLEKELVTLDIPTSDKLVQSALKHVKILEDLEFELIKISLKSSDVPTMIEAYEKLSKIVNYPLHLGVTEAGTIKSGLIKSSIGIGSLLNQGIGDTIRVSLTDDPVEEIYAGFEILKALGLRKKGINFVSCPTCGRCQINLIELAKQIEEKYRNLETPITIAVMGCAVNGPGEAKAADIGIAGGIGEGYIFRKGEIIAKIPEANLIEAFDREIKNILKLAINKRTSH